MNPTPEPKFKIGQTILILSRQPAVGQWENSNVGRYAVIESVVTYNDHNQNQNRYSYDNMADGWLYALQVLDDVNNYFVGSRHSSAYEERFLELFCSNVKRGQELLLKKRR